MKGDPTTEIKDLRKMIGKSWRVVRRPGGHVKFLCPCGEHIVVVSSSKGHTRGRSHANTVARLKACPMVMA